MRSTEESLGKRNVKDGSLAASPSVSRKSKTSSKYATVSSNASSRRRAERLAAMLERQEAEAQIKVELELARENAEIEKRKSELKLKQLEEQQRRKVAQRKSKRVS